MPDLTRLSAASCRGVSLHCHVVWEKAIFRCIKSGVVPTPLGRWGEDCCGTRVCSQPKGQLPLNDCRLSDPGTTLMGFALLMETQHVPPFPSSYVSVCLSGFLSLSVPHTVLVYPFVRPSPLSLPFCPLAVSICLCVVFFLSSLSPSLPPSL